MENLSEIFDRITQAAAHRRDLCWPEGACRLFNGFYEGCPDLVLDRFGETLVIFDHAAPGRFDDLIPRLVDWSQSDWPGCRCVVHKQRQHPDHARRGGVLLVGEHPAQSVQEDGVVYALDLVMHQDASFYLDTRHLRAWLRQNAAGMRVLNTFAYTGSLGVAAGVGGAAQVVQTDLNGSFLAVARQSWNLNQLPPERQDLVTGDFFRVAGRLRHRDQLFDMVIIDPPFFSTTEAGRVDLLHETTRLINKIRPLVAHEGWLVVVNNALFLPGETFLAEMEALCQSPYLTYAAAVPAPDDVTGFPQTVVSPPPVDPAPFNHPTKIVLLRVMRKDERR